MGTFNSPSPTNVFDFRPEAFNGVFQLPNKGRDCNICISEVFTSCTDICWGDTGGWKIPWAGGGVNTRQYLINVNIKLSKTIRNTLSLANGDGFVFKSNSVTSSTNNISTLFDTPGGDSIRFKWKGDSSVNIKECSLSIIGQ